MSNNQNISISKGLIFLLLFLFFAILFLIIFIISFALSSTSRSIKPHTPTKSYQHQTIQTYSNKPIKGRIESIELLTDEHFIGYSNPVTGSYSLISNFGDSQYECSGYCYCSEDEKKRRTATLLNRGLLLILSALSAPMALRMANEAFFHQCTQQFAEVCDEENIKAEVDSCEEPIITEKEDDKSGLHVQYMCKGHCVNQEPLKSDLDYQLRQEYFNYYERLKEKECETIENEHEVFFRRVWYPFSDQEELKWFVYPLWKDETVRYDRGRKYSVSERKEMEMKFVVEQFKSQFDPICRFYGANKGNPFVSKKDASKVAKFDTKFEYSFCSGITEDDRNIECWEVELEELDRGVEARVGFEEDYKRWKKEGKLWNDIQDREGDADWRVPEFETDEDLKRWIREKDFEEHTDN